TAALGDGFHQLLVGHLAHLLDHVVLLLEVREPRLRHKHGVKGKLDALVRRKVRVEKGAQQAVAKTKIENLSCGSQCEWQQVPPRAHAPRHSLPKCISTK